MRSFKLLKSGSSLCNACLFRYNGKFAPSQIFRATATALYTAPRRPLCTDVIPPATLEGDEKKYAPKIEKLVDEISRLSLVEVADLNELLKKTLKIPDVPTMAFSSGPAAKPSAEEEEEPEPVKQEKSLFTVRLVKFDETKKVAVIKEIKSLVPGMNLVQAKKFVESAPQVVRAEVPKDEAEKLKATLDAVGAIVEVD